MTQCQIAHRHLMDYGSITPQEVTNEYGISVYRLEVDTGGSGKTMLQLKDHGQ